MQPLATYHERFPLYMKRKFELYEDRIVVTVSKLLSRQEVPIDLTTIDPNAGSLWRVRPYFPIAVIIGFILLLLSPLAIKVFVRPVAWTHWGLSAVVLALLIRSLVKIEFAQFRNIANVVVLDIARHGPDRSKHEAFVDRIMMQAEMARQKLMQSAVIRLETPPEDDDEFRVD